MKREGVRVLQGGRRGRGGVAAAGAGGECP